MTNEKKILSMLEGLTATVKAQGQMIERGQAETNQRFDKLDDKVDKLDVRVGNLESKVDKLDDRVGNLESKVDKLDDRVGNLESKVDKLQEDIQVIKEDVCFTRTLVGEAFKDILMLDNRTGSLKRVK